MLFIKTYDDFLISEKYIQANFSNSGKSFYLLELSEYKDLLKIYTECIFNDNYELFYNSKEYKIFRKWLKSHLDDNIILYHGTSIDNIESIEKNGILTTKNSTKRSYQSETGYVYLSVYEDSSKLFGDIAYPSSKGTIVYKLSIPISCLYPDKDQIYNKNSYSKMSLKNDLETSLVITNGARVKGDIPKYMIVDKKIIPK